ncbi:hypothetical protein L9G16_09470 [Shewanella sp. A25]|nr:hypothetical protein [Shewanella shenzhenensis]
MINKFKFVFISVFVLFMSGCAMQPQIAAPNQLIAPQPIEGNTGEFMSPFTSDGVMTEWVDKAVNADMGATIGGLAGAYAGQKLAEQIPFVGGWIGSEIGNSVGREVAIEMSGGEELIKSSSDLSFNNLADLAVWMYVTHSTNPHYQDALESAQAIYPDLKTIYGQALYEASRNATINNSATASLL